MAVMCGRRIESEAVAIVYKTASHPEEAYLHIFNFYFQSRFLLQ